MNSFRNFMFVLLIFASAFSIHAKDIKGELSGKLTVSSSPYHVKGDIIIPPDKTLTIPAGVVIKFDTVAVFEVRGKLIAVGTTQKPILFTSGQKKPQPNDWKGIFFTNSADNKSVLKFCRIEYARTGVRVISTSPTISNCEIKNGEDNGILLKTSRSEISFNVIQQNKNDGIVAENFKGKIENNKIIANGDDGIDLRKSKCLVKKNIISENYDDGVVANDCDAKIFLNKIMKNRDDGVLVNGKKPAIAFNGIIRNTYGIFVYGKSNPVIQNNTIVQGTYGIYIRDNSKANVVNTISWDNVTEIFTDSTSTIEISYSDVNAEIPGKNNINKDPEFASEDDFQLLPTSPCIGKAKLNPPIRVPNSLKGIIGAYPVKK